MRIRSSEIEFYKINATIVAITSGDEVKVKVMAKTPGAKATPKERLLGVPLFETDLDASADYQRVPFYTGENEGVLYEFRNTPGAAQPDSWIKAFEAIRDSKIAVNGVNTGVKFKVFDINYYRTPAKLLLMLTL
jgi:hypothetical protein